VADAFIGRRKHEQRHAKARHLRDALQPQVAVLFGAIQAAGEERCRVPHRH
jgi:hypothetical protein